MMNEENMMDDETPPTARSESAFFGTSNETKAITATLAAEIANPNPAPLTEPETKPLRPTRYGHSLALLIPKKLIPRHSKRDILEVRIMQASDSSKNKSLYTKHRPGYKRAYLDLFQLSPGPSDEYRVATIRAYSLDDFVRDYNQSRPKGFENVELVCEDDQLALVVDIHRVLLKGLKLRTYQGQVILECVLGEAGAVKVVKSVEGFTIRLRDHSPVTSVRFRDGGLALTYSRTGHDTHLHTRPVERPTQSDMVEENRDWTGRLGIHVAEKAEGQRDWYLVEADFETLRLISEELTAAEDDLDAFRETKGAIAEDIVRYLVPEFAMNFVKDHPHSPPWWPSRTKKPGPDLLVRMTDTGRLAYIESKWWDKAADALRRAVRQVALDLAKFPTWEGEKVAAGFAVVLEWELDSTRFRVHLQQANQPAEQTLNLNGAP